MPYLQGQAAVQSILVNDINSYLRYGAERKLYENEQ